MATQLNSFFEGDVYLYSFPMHILTFLFFFLNKSILVHKGTHGTWGKFWFISKVVAE